MDVTNFPRCPLLNNGSNRQNGGRGHTGTGFRMLILKSNYDRNDTWRLQSSLCAPTLDPGMPLSSLVRWIDSGIARPYVGELIGNNVSRIVLIRNCSPVYVSKRRVISN